MLPGTGNRELADVAPAALEDFLPGYAAALLGQIPCMRMDAPVSERAALVDGQTVGIVYHTVQFCDYYAPGLTAPEQFHLPVLKIETDCSRQTFTSGGGQLSTRLGAFAESLNAVPDTENKEAPAMNTNAQYAAGHRQRLCQHRCRDPGSQRKDLRLGHWCPPAPGLQPALARHWNRP